MKQQLENDTDESNWIANAAIATGLDVLDFAMGMVEGIPLGILDTKNIGEGLAEGTWEGAKKDISRALNVLPQGKILKAVDRALTASDVVEAVDKGDLKEAGIAVGMAVLSVASKGKKEDKGKKKGTGALRRRKADRDALMAKSRQELGKKLGPPENYSYGKGRFATYEASKVSGMESHHMIPEALFARGPASLMGLADYVPAMPVSMLEHRGVGGQGSANLTESLNTILKDKYYGKILTRADLSRAIDEVRAYYGNLGLKEYAASVAEFRNRLFDKL